MSGDKIDHGGCVNTLTTLRPSPLAKETRNTLIWSRSKNITHDNHKFWHDILFEKQ